MNFPPHNDNCCRCPRCSEIELRHTRTDGELMTFECPCGHEETAKFSMNGYDVYVQKQADG